MTETTRPVMLIEAMKKVKDLQEKKEDLRRKVAQYSADYETETPTYGTPEAQREQVKQWLQAHGDISKEILHLRLSIQQTNLATMVPIELGGKNVTKSIAGWIHRRRDLANDDRELWAGLGRRESNMPEGVIQSSTGDKVERKIRRYYLPKDRDEMVEAFRSEPFKIDATLEVVNATTPLIEA